MMGSPFYYDVLFDDGPGDVVFHDCMWSGICTCCINLIHQDSSSMYYASNESPDLKVDLSTYQYQQQLMSSNGNNSIDNNTSNAGHNANAATSSGCLTKESHLLSNSHIYNTTNIINNSPVTACSQANHHMNHNNATLQNTCSAAAQALAATASATSINNHHHHTNNYHHHNHLHQQTSNCTNINNRLLDNLNNNNHVKGSTSTSVSPDHTNSSPNSTSPDYTNSSSNSTSPDTGHSSSLSNSTSPKPVRRREHNDSERKRRDHLRNAFNFLRDQVPRFKAISKKPPRIQILHEATSYVRNIMKESQELERRLAEERTKHERLQQQSQNIKH